MRCMTSPQPARCRTEPVRTDEGTTMTNPYEPQPAPPGPGGQAAETFAPPAPPPYPSPQQPGAPGYYYGPPAAQKQTTNGFAIASMVLGIVWIYWIGSILALVFGYIAKKQIEQANGREGGGGMATAGIVLGWVGVGFFALLMVILMISAATGPRNT